MPGRKEMMLGLAAMALAADARAQESEPFRPFADTAYRLVNSIAFHPANGEMYVTLFAREVQKHRGLATGGAPEVGLYRSRRERGGWSEPEAMAVTGAYDSYEPTVSSDGRVMVFNSRRPYPDGRTPDVNDLWMTEWTGAQWGAPRRITSLSTFDAEESYAAFAGAESLVFLRDAAAVGEAPRYDLYESAFRNGEFLPPSRHPVSTDRWGEGDPWVSRDGSVLIFTRWDDHVGWRETVDLYLALRGETGWSTPVPLTELNTAGPDYGPASSPDEQWLYYRADAEFRRIDLEALLAPYRARLLPPRE